MILNIIEHYAESKLETIRTLCNYKDNDATTKCADSVFKSLNDNSR